MAGSPIIDIDLLTPTGLQQSKQISSSERPEKRAATPENARQNQTKNSKPGKSRIFETRPQVRVTEIENVKKNMFQSFRQFTLRTEPNGWSVKRNRDDFKWLVKHLREEHPSDRVSSRANDRSTRSTRESSPKRPSSCSSSRSPRSGASWTRGT